MKSFCKWLLLLILLFLLTGCESNRYMRVNRMFRSGNYAAAVEELDNYIKTTNNGAYKTLAELDRSEAYYRLAQMAVQRKNWKLAVRFLLLSNSEKADHLLDKCYYQLGDTAIQNNDMTTGVAYLDLIINEIPSSELVPDVLYRRLQIALNTYHDKDQAWKLYMLLFNRFPNSTTELSARPMVDTFAGEYVDKAVALAAKREFDQALTILFELSNYPVGDLNRINREISNIYHTKGDEYLVAQNYPDAVANLNLAIQYDPYQKDMINLRLRNICDVYVTKGRSFLVKQDFANADLNFKKTFEVISNYEPAVKGLAESQTIRRNIATAADLAVQGDQMETKRKFKEALPFFQQAFELNHLEEYSRRIFVINNILEAEKNPEAFARKIVFDYGKGTLNTQIQAKKRSLLVKYKPDEVKDSGWRFLLSPGQYKLEARYDLYTPGQSYFYVWQINMKDRTLTPLNKLSESLMK